MALFLECLLRISVELSKITILVFVLILPY